MKRILSALILAAGLSTAAQAEKFATAELIDNDGKAVGKIGLAQTKSEGVWLNIDIQKLPAGAHAFHIHETGKCEGDFKSAGGHFDPTDNKHGAMTEGGDHAGDLPNIHVSDNGSLKQEVFAKAVTLEKGVGNSLFDEDGSAFVIHAGADDYESQPSGAAGARIACGVIKESVGD